MIAFLEGRFDYKSPAVVHMDVHGVGYEVFISLNTYTAISAKEGGRLYTHLQVKEDAHVLYGFADVVEKEIFVQLISVSGVGASTARMVLSSLKPDEVRQAVASGNVRLLESIKGIGRKTAERLVLELKDKTAKAVALPGTPGAAATPDPRTDAVNTLVALGISKNQADIAVQKVLAAEPHQTNLEDLIKKALKNI